MWIILWPVYLLRTSVLQLFYCRSSIGLSCELFCGQSIYWGHLYFNYSIVSPASDFNVNYSVVSLSTEDICTSIILLSVQPQIVMWIILWPVYLLRTSVLQLFYCRSSIGLSCELFCGQSIYWGHLYFNYSIVSPASDFNVNYSVVSLSTEDICTLIILLSVQPQIVMWIILWSGYLLRTSVLQLLYCRPSIRL